MKQIKIEINKIVLHSTSVRKSAKNIYTKKEYIDFKNSIKRQVYKQRDHEIIENKPLILEIHVMYPIPKSYSNKKRANLEGKPKITVPDVDNISKSILDALSETLYSDDKLIIKLIVSKKWGTIEQKNIIITLSYNVL